MKLDAQEDIIIFPSTNHYRIASNISIDVTLLPRMTWEVSK